MIESCKDFRRWLYRHLPGHSPRFYHARRRGLDHWAIRGRSGSVAEIQKRFLLHWVGKTKGCFVEWDAGDGIVGSHALWLEEAGWRGFSHEERERASALLKQNRPLAGQCDRQGRLDPVPGTDLVTARRTASIRQLVGQLVLGTRPRWVILQARDPQPEIFRIIVRAGYRLDHFIHDDEYYRLQKI